jgi:hypothetical protein
MSKPLLHLDADTSIKALQTALLSRDRDVTRTPTDWMPLDASDETQLLGATARGRCIFTFNIRVIPNMVASFWLLKTVGHYLV